MIDTPHFPLPIEIKERWLLSEETRETEFRRVAAVSLDFLFTFFPQLLLALLDFQA